MIGARHLTVGSLVVALVATLVATGGFVVRAPGDSAHPDAPPPAYTGGFGEPTCHECHFQRDLDAGPGTLGLDSLPARVDVGSTHRLSVTLTQPGQLRAGFMLSARTADGTQAGTLGTVDATATITRAGDVAYLHHTLAGTAVTGDRAVWSFEWTADDLTTGDSVLFHLVGNATNDDESPFGDYVYSAVETVIIR